MEVVNVERLKELRINEGLSQRELSQKARLSPGAVHQVETRGRANPKTLKAIADVLDVKATDLLGKD
jgi:transcriptional regulator with XRE-family HTH domain